MEAEKSNITTPIARTGYIFEERYCWHDPGVMPGGPWLEPVEHWENQHTKRRMHNLITTSGLINHLSPVPARPATREEICRFHTEAYHDSIEQQSRQPRGGMGGEHNATFGHGGYEICALSAGGVLAGVEAIVDGRVDNAYCLVRPPGHHATADCGMGFCLFNNIVIGALHARTLTTQSGAKIQRVVIVDYDVHHGNGTQDAFYKDKDCLFISLHQDSNYPEDSGTMFETGEKGMAEGTNINIPLPPGSGSGAYDLAFETVVLPAIRRFNPDFIFVSSGFDASFQDPIASMMLSSESFRSFASSMIKIANAQCGGRILFAHEGGYSKDYVPFCGLAVVEALCGRASGVEDGYLAENRSWGYQACQPHQAGVIRRVAEIHGLPVHADLATTEADGTLSADEQQVLNTVRSALGAVQDKKRRRLLVDHLLALEAVGGGSSN